MKPINITDDSFMEMVNHELKSPLTSIKIFIETFQKKIPDYKNKDLENKLKSVDNKIDYLTSLINDYTDIVRIQSGALILKKESLLLKSTLENCFKKIQTKFKKVQIKNSNFTNKKINIDKDRLFQIFNNLIIYINKVSGEEENIEIEIKSNSRYIVFNVRNIGYQYSNNNKLNYFDPEIISENQIKSVNIKPNLRIGSCLVAEIISFYHGKFMICSDVNYKIACCFSIPLSS